MHILTANFIIIGMVSISVDDIMRISSGSFKLKYVSFQIDLSKSIEDADLALEFCFCWSAEDADFIC